MDETRAGEENLSVLNAGLDEAATRKVAGSFDSGLN